jgi:hypothetical protein
MMKEAVKWCLFFACVVVITNQVFAARPAQAGSIAPPVSEFTYTTSAGQKIHVNSWTRGAVQCTALSTDAARSTEIPLAISCTQ